MSAAKTMNPNVKFMLAFLPCLTVCTSLATSSTLAAYILLKTDSNAAVGYAVGAQGVANLVAAFPAAYLGDRFSRRGVIAGAVALGVLGFAAMAFCVLVLNTASVWTQYTYICCASGTIGLFMGGQSSSAEAIFGDSVESGQRSRLYARKASLKVLGNAAGPLVSIIVFAVAGNDWREGELKIVILAGSVFFLVPASLVLSLREKWTLGGSLSESLLAPERAESDDDDEVRRRREVRIASCVCCADVVSMLGSGMTVKFFPLFFWREVGMSPIQVQIVYFLAPVGISVAALGTQRLSRRFGRIETTLATKLSGISLLVAMTRVGDGYTVVVLYLLRTWLMNCCQGLTRSVLNDYVRKSERARWNAAESINLFSWSGSAVLGGYLIDRHGYRATFLVTAGLQLCSAAILAPLACVVQREKALVPSDAAYSRLERPPAREAGVT